MSTGNLQARLILTREFLPSALYAHLLRQAAKDERRRTLDVLLFELCGVNPS